MALAIKKRRRVGVFVCHCGKNIADTVDVAAVVRAIAKHPDVAFATEYKYVCSEPGQKIVTDAIREQHLDGIVIAACSPTLHEGTFRAAAQRAGLNPYQCEIANIREQCSWVHPSRAAATAKAKKIVRTIVEKVSANEPLTPLAIPITRRALVLGGGVAGIQAALNIANSGHEVILVERGPSIGGRMAQLSETFPTLDCSQCILTPKMVEVARHPRIKLLTLSELTSVTGYVGNFHVTITRQPRRVIEGTCNLCGECLKVCPVVRYDEFDRGLKWRKAIYLPFPQAVPTCYTIDPEACIECAKCEKVCDVKAIDFDAQPVTVEEEVGAIVVATGYDLYPVTRIGEYGAGRYPDVIDSLLFERLLSASGPTGGEVRRPSDQTVPKDVVFIQCVGSRDPATHLPYCSKICCMYTAKHAMLYKHRVPDGRAHIFYIDIRSGGKGYEEFVQRAVEEDGIFYIRGRVSKIFPRDGKLIVWGADTLAGKQIEVAADLVVLATGMVPGDGLRELASRLKIAVDENGFTAEAHPKLRPVESLTAGVYVAGCVQSPKDIPEAVAQASGAASYVNILFAEKELYREPQIACVDETICTGCGICVATCPYGARELDPTLKVAVVREALCEGCGACVAACPAGATSQKNLADPQIARMVEAALEDASADEDQD